MAKKAPNNDSFADLQFPLSGIDLTTEFEEQRTGTTQEGVNVRAFEPITNRGRGGQRAGLGKYIPHTVGLIDENGDDAPPNVIQHLAIIVDPTVEGLLSDDDELGGPNRVNDPSTSNRRRRIPIGQTRTVRRGGSGGQTQKNQPRPALVITADNQTKNQGDTFTFSGTEFSSSGLQIVDTLTTATLRSKGAKASALPGDYPITIRNVQGSVLGDGSGAAGLRKKYRISYVPGIMTVGSVDPFVTAALGFGSTGTGLVATVPLTGLEVGDIVVIWILSTPDGFTIADTQSNSYSQIGGNVPIAGYPLVPPDDSDFSMYSAIAGSNGANTISITLNNVTNNPSCGAIAVVYRGFLAIEDSSSGSGTGTAVATGTIGVTVPASIVLACYVFPGQPSPLLTFATPGMTSPLADSPTSPGGGGDGVFLIVFTQIFPVMANVDAALTSNVSVSWAAIGASFNP